ncbi:hypothetical protein [Roseomonas chloroacetimidivorans]|uniref:hypothetical protein n=1 Tax=Roseomonas chloroacetimidivorans TaxID=1766656 RepID=UPI003C73EF24
MDSLPPINVRSRERRVSSSDSLDFFRTPPGATQALLEKESFPGRVWECACGDGIMSRAMEVAGYDVFSSDLVDRGYGHVGRDFLLTDSLPQGVESVVTNPPFKLGTEFVQHALNMGARKVAILQRVAFLEGQERASGIFADGKLSRVWVFAKRITLWRGDDPNPQDKGGAMAFCWCVWERGHRGTQLGWIR